ncbi:MAG: DUF2268 domain-containing protein, partial [Bacillaceae bacterium]|nr:DUF2268 domain-containing protein [Bacillaceae bacterium]
NCEPITDKLNLFDPMSLHQYLLEQGLFHPDADVEEELFQLEKMNVWKIVEDQYEKLRKLWDGAKADIFIFPVERRNEVIMKELKGKMGISFSKVIVLFLSKELTVKQIRSLFTHEYHHACRLDFLNKSIDQVNLLDSILIEGMAEVAVEYYHDAKMLAPWVNLYTKKQIEPYWKTIVPYLELRGKEKHDPILYGNSRHGFPKWFGYCAGFHIVKSYLEANESVTMKELLKTESIVILEGSFINN